MKHNLEAITKRWKSRMKDRVAADLDAAVLHKMANLKQSSVVESLKVRSNVDKSPDPETVNDVGERKLEHVKTKESVAGETVRPPTYAEEENYSPTDKPKAVS